jgi:hypothetical protein
MLASGNYARFIYDGNGDEQGFAGPKGSGDLEQVYKDWYDSQGLAYETIPFDGRSDYDAFTDVGIRHQRAVPRGAQGRRGPRDPDIRADERVRARHGPGHDDSDEGLGLEGRPAGPLALPTPDDSNGAPALAGAPLISIPRGSRFPARPKPLIHPGPGEPDSGARGGCPEGDECCPARP